MAASLVERAAAFEAAFPVRDRTAGGLDWRFYEGGAGEVVLLLTGGTGIAIGWLDLGLALRGRNRVIAVDYPAAGTFAELADGVAALLAAEGADHVHVVGQSMGGMLAEVLSRRYPDLVRSLTLTGTGLYGQEDRARLSAKREEVAAARWEEVREQVRQALRATWTDAAELGFWLARIDVATAGERGRARMLSTYDAFLELIDRVSAMREEPGVRRPAFLQRAEDDPLITERQFQRLLEMHPGAEVSRPPAGGHSRLITRPGDYVREVVAFLDGVGA